MCALFVTHVLSYILHQYHLSSCCSFRCAPPPFPRPSCCCTILVHRLAAVFVPARSPALLSPSPFFLLQQQQVVCGPDSLPFAATLELISFPRLCLGWQYPVSGSRFFGVPPTYAVIAR
eukprot:RCo054731